MESRPHSALGRYNELIHKTRQFLGWSLVAMFLAGSGIVFGLPHVSSGVHAYLSFTLALIVALCFSAVVLCALLTIFYSRARRALASTDSGPR